jgi:hypothetical protein
MSRLKDSPERTGIHLNFINYPSGRTLALQKKLFENSSKNREDLKAARILASGCVIPDLPFNQF